MPASPDHASPKAGIRAAFSKAATHYDDAAFLQQEIARRLDERLDVMKVQPGTILEAGCGTGYAFPLLRARFPDARLIGLDLAPGMLQRARAHCTPPSTLAKLGKRLGFQTGLKQACHLVCSDIEQLPLARNSVDMVWSNVALQWVGPPDAAFREVERVLKPGGLFLFSTFGPDTLQELRSAFSGLDGHAHVNRFIDMHDLGDALMHAGFSSPVMEMERITLTYTELKPLLAELKAIGAHTVLGARRHGLMGRNLWQHLQDNYERFRKDGRLPATYEVVYGHAWASAKDRREDGRQIIQMKIERKRGGLA